MTFEVPGAEENPSYELVADVVERLSKLVPKTTVGLPPAGQIARRVYSRLYSRYQAIGILLAMNLPEEAYTLTRALMHDSQRLQLMAAASPAEQERLAVYWHSEATLSTERRAHMAARLGAATLASRSSVIAGRNRAANTSVAAAHGTQPKKFPKEGGPIAEATGHPEDELDYAMASDPAHSAIAAAIWHDRNGGPRGTLAGGNDPAWTRYVAGRATRHMVRAAAAMGSICGLPTTPDLEALRDEIEGELDSGRLPGPERL